MALKPQKNSAASIQVKPDSKTNIIGRTVLRYDSVDSTNAVARKLGSEGVEEGTVILANTQTKGIGRLNRTWVSPKGGLWFSIILRPNIRPSEATKLTLMAGSVVAKTLKALYDLNARIKWPNDVLINGKKICGILNEMRTSGDDIDYL
ncbi:MAG: biotin--[acetyl-CoA-carboxylase] ligase, partial [Methanomassiliicoccales archaeon]